jgi:hypothetical protein
MTAVPSETEWRALCERLADEVPFQLLTVLEVDWDKALVRRLYSSDEEHYPGGGVKRLMQTAWGRQVLHEGRVLRADGPDEMKAAFGDHELLLSLGLTHAINVPVMREGRVAWTLNLLRGHPAFDDDEVGRVRGLLSAGAHL